MEGKNQGDASKIFPGITNVRHALKCAQWSPTKLSPLHGKLCIIQPMRLGAPTTLSAKWDIGILSRRTPGRTTPT